MYPAAASFSRTKSNALAPNLNPSTTTPVSGSTGVTNTVIVRSTVISPLVAVNVNSYDPPVNGASLIAVNCAALPSVISANSLTISSLELTSNACAADNSTALSRSNPAASA